MKIARCRGPHCGAEIIWTVTPTGARQPFDAEPSSTGTFVLDESTDPPTSRILGLLDPDGLELYMPHHATCPDVQEFR